VQIDAKLKLGSFRAELENANAQSTNKEDD
jgi:hypothetical protein